MSQQSMQRINQIRININSQRLNVYFFDGTSIRFIVSTSNAGAGNREGSYQTPTGWHTICAKIGSNQPARMIFKSRQPTGKLAKIQQLPKNTGEDMITSRILWLDGLEPGINRGDQVDSKQRYIYIHGTHEEGLLGSPASKGCIRMSNKDVITFFDMVDLGSRILIHT